MMRRPWPDERFIYAIREDRKAGLIKIGTASDVERRRRELQQACAHPLKLVGVELWVGSDARLEEGRIHHVLKNYRATRYVIARRGLCGVREWFHPKPEVLAYIADWSPNVADALTYEPLRLEWSYPVCSA